MGDDGKTTDAAADSLRGFFDLQGEAMREMFAGAFGGALTDEGVQALLPQGIDAGELGDWASASVQLQQLWLDFATHQAHVAAEKAAKGANPMDPAQWLVISQSMLGQMPTLLTGAYASTKFAVSCFTEVLYHENRDRGVRFVCVCPPAVSTPLVDQARATAWPKLLDENPFMEPGPVLDAIEVSLDKGEFWVFPGKNTKMGWRMRRFLPDAVWKHVHKTEGW